MGLLAPAKPKKDNEPEYGSLPNAALYSTHATSHIHFAGSFRSRSPRIPGLRSKCNEDKDSVHACHH
jgi:hypothetical protein